MTGSDYHIVKNDNGSCSVGCRQTGEVMHPLIGPEAEARRLYVEGLNLPDRVRDQSFCIWDVGMGAAANVLVAVQALAEVPTRLRIESFDRTSAALCFARAHPDKFGFVDGFEHEAGELIESGRVEFQRGRAVVDWVFREGDFLEQSRDCPPPAAVFFDPWSPLRNSGMWTLSVFEHLYSCLDEDQPCTLATYSRATCVRSALLLGGFFVGKGPGAGAKEESTVAAADPAMLDAPLPRSWLDKAARSHSGRPLYSSAFTQEPLPGEMMEQLRVHPQFR